MDNNGLLDKYKPVRLAEFNAVCSVVVVLVHLIRRFIRNTVGPLETTGIMVGIVLGVIWAVVTLIRAYLMAKKGIFAESQGYRSRWKLMWIFIEMSIPFAIGYCCLLFARAKISGFKFSDAVWSLILFVFFTYFFVSSIGYYFLEWRFGRKFYDRPDK